MSREEIADYSRKNLKIDLFTPEQILSIHQLLITLYGGVSDLRSQEMYEVIKELTDKLNACPSRLEAISCATDIIYTVIRKSPFIVANKRTAYFVANIYLYMYGFSISAEPKDALTLLRKLGDGTLSREEISEWLRSHLSSETLTAL